MGKWTKRGLIHVVEQDSDWEWSHAHKPTPFLVDEQTLRIYFGVRGKDGKTRTTFLDADPEQPHKVKYVHREPVLDLGKLGAFDDCGANVSSVLAVDDRVYMYFIGWNPGTTVHTRNAIGLAISEDGGYSFKRAYDGAVLDRNKDEPYYTGAVDVIRDKGRFKVWYTSGTQWIPVNGRPEISYHIKYAESENGIDWQRQNTSCILPQEEFEVTARPSVILDDGLYRMWYSRRNIDGFRDRPDRGYRAGYAESGDGVNWMRLDHLAGVEPSLDGWDAQAIAYPFVARVNDRLYMFYNGNGFGLTGFGYAEYLDDA